MTPNEDAQKRYLALQHLEQKIQQLQQHLALLNQQRAELLLMIQHLDDLERVKLDSKSFVTLGAGIYLSSEVKDTKHVLVNVGAGVLVLKTPGEAKAMLQKQVADVQSIQQQAENELQKMVLEGRTLQSELQGLVSSQS